MFTFRKKEDKLIENIMASYSPSNPKNIHNISKPFEQFFPFCNEKKFDVTIGKLRETKPVSTGSRRIAMLIGESNFLSILPELKEHADVILLNDVNEYIHIHTTHLLDCMFRSENPKEFKKLYCNKNPLTRITIIGNKGETCLLSIDQLCKHLDSSVHDLKDRHFLSSNKRFIECKKALSNILIKNIRLDIYNLRECENFSKIMKLDSAVMTLINFTNIHDYDRGNLKYIIKLFCDRSLPTILLYSSGGIKENAILTSQLTTDMNQYMGMFRPSGGFSDISNISLTWHLLGFLKPTERAMMSRANKAFKKITQLLDEENALISVTPNDMKIEDAIKAIASTLNDFNNDAKSQKNIHHGRMGL